MTLKIAAAVVVSAVSASAAWADCQSDVTSLRSELEAKGAALQAAGKKKADPQTLCPLFRSFATAEANWVKFLQSNKDWCQIPDEAIKQAIASNKKTNQVRDQVCKVAATGMAPGGPATPPPQGSMSSALGITTGYSISKTPNGRSGVFDTLSGNALQK
ncbi:MULTISPECIES: hypothetical protein [unclassified Xanthobacter]|uniref:hypothetical protein n=1 Tax=unclassified Xanthobacter TaxID=2623496 RepID=UPI001EDD8B81|nr:MULTISPECIES: hypothetical protein [unclassified Xanthobacter]